MDLQKRKKNLSDIFTISYSYLKSVDLVVYISLLPEPDVKDLMALEQTDNKHAVWGRLYWYISFFLLILNKLHFRTNAHKSALEPRTVFTKR